MKKIYWRPHRVSRVELILISSLSIAGLASVETFKITEKQPYYAEKVQAARLAHDAMSAIKEERLFRKLPIDPEADPAESGLIGPLLSEVTSNNGSLAAKQTSINPNFAAVVVELLKKTGAQRGDVVAIGLSGSFPAMNVAVIAAVEVLGLKPIVITSVAGSQWGANDPNFLWLDMEKVLEDRRLISVRSIAASRGGIEDRGLGMSRIGRGLLDQAIERNGLEKISPANYEDSVALRLEIYQERAGSAPIRAYINVGGGTSSVGTKVGKLMFQPGLNRAAPRGAREIDSVMTRFVNQGVPVIHLVHLAKLAERYGFPIQPRARPRVGDGTIFVKQAYNVWIALGTLAVVLGTMIAFIRMDLGFRILRGGVRPKRGGHPEQMI